MKPSYSPCRLAGSLAKKSGKSFSETSNFMKSSHTSLHPRIRHPHEPNEPTTPSEKINESVMWTLLLQYTTIGYKDVLGAHSVSWLLGRTNSRL